MKEKSNLDIAVGKNTYDAQTMTLILISFSVTYFVQVCFPLALHVAVAVRDRSALKSGNSPQSWLLVTLV